MPSLLEHQSQDVTKALILGESGSGKTTSLISLVEAGYSLRILDFDNGLNFLTKLIQARCPEKLDSVYYATFTDKFMTGQGRAMLGVPTAFTGAFRLIDNWKTETEDLGSVTSWGPQDVLVVDSLTFMCNAAMRAAMVISGHLNMNPTQPDWLTAMRLVEDVLALLYSTAVKCNVVVTSHIKYLTLDGEALIKGLPLSLGQALPPKVGRYFNEVFLIERRGQGVNEQRLILTRSKGLVDLKSGSPKTPPELPLETGLADYFKLVREKPDKEGGKDVNNLQRSDGKGPEPAPGHSGATEAVAGGTVPGNNPGV